jgi:hypothetical protein
MRQSLAEPRSYIPSSRILRSRCPAWQCRCWCDATVVRSDFEVPAAVPQTVDCPASSRPLPASPIRRKSWRRLRRNRGVVPRINRGVLLPPRLDEQWLLSVAHTKAGLECALEVLRSFVAAVVERLGAWQVTERVAGGRSLLSFLPSALRVPSTQLAGADPDRQRALREGTGSLAERRQPDLDGLRRLHLHLGLDGPLRTAESG